MRYAPHAGRTSGLSHSLIVRAAACRFPHDYGGETTLCARCLDEHPPYASARSAIVYDDKSKAMVLRFKHGDQLYLAPSFAHWMMRAAPEISTKSVIFGACAAPLDAPDVPAV